MQHIPPARKHLAQGRHLPELWQLAATPPKFQIIKNSHYHIDLAQRIIAAAHPEQVKLRNL